MAAGFDLIARGCRREEHCAETGEGGEGGDHGRVRPPRLHGIRESANCGHAIDKHFIYRVSNPIIHRDFRISFREFPRLVGRSCS